MKQSAVITFGRQEEQERAREKPVQYNNWTLNWSEEKKKEFQEKEILDEEAGP